MIVQDEPKVRLPVHPVLVMLATDEVTVMVVAAFPLLVTVTGTGAGVLPTATEPTGMTAGVAVMFAFWMGGVTVGPSIPGVIEPSGVRGFDELPPQLTTVSMPMSPRQLA
jgi:hypothetical protein